MNVVKPVASPEMTSRPIPVAVVRSATILAMMAAAKRGNCSMLLDWAFSARWYFWKLQMCKCRL
jgi:hypothetical protein